MEDQSELILETVGTNEKNLPSPDSLHQCCSVKKISRQWCSLFQRIISSEEMGDSDETDEGGEESTDDSQEVVHGRCFQH